jgi:hypothetical protein
VATVGRVGLGGGAKKFCASSAALRRGSHRQLHAIRCHRAQDDAYLSSGVAAEGGVIRTRKDFELTDGVDARSARVTVEFRVADVDAVELVVVRVLTRAIHVERDVATDAGGRTLSRRGHTGQQQGQLQEIAAVEREPADQVIVEDEPKPPESVFRRLRVAVTSTRSVIRPGMSGISNRSS